MTQDASKKVPQKLQPWEYHGSEGWDKEICARCGKVEALGCKAGGGCEFWLEDEREIASELDLDMDMDKVCLCDYEPPCPDGDCECRAPYNWSAAGACPGTVRGEDL